MLNVSSLISTATSSVIAKVCDPDPDPSFAWTVRKRKTGRNERKSVREEQLVFGFAIFNTRSAAAFALLLCVCVFSFLFLSFPFFVNRMGKVHASASKKKKKVHVNALLPPSLCDQIKCIELIKNKYQSIDRSIDRCKKDGTPSFPRHRPALPSFPQLLVLSFQVMLLFCEVTHRLGTFPSVLF